MSELTTATTRKQLETQLKVQKGELDAKKTMLTSLMKEYQQKLRAVESLQKKIEKMGGDGPPVITDHAMLRYMERVMGLDVEGLRAKLITPAIQKMIDTLGGNGQYPGDGYVLVMKNNAVTTILKAK